jgi:hypothetical protein
MLPIALGHPYGVLVIHLCRRSLSTEQNVNSHEMLSDPLWKPWRPKLAERMSACLRALLVEAASLPSSPRKPTPFWRGWLRTSWPRRRTLVVFTGNDAYRTAMLANAGAGPICEERHGTVAQRALALVRGGRGHSHCASSRGEPTNGLPGGHEDMQKGRPTSSQANWAMRCRPAVSRTGVR